MARAPAVEQSDAASPTPAARRREASDTALIRALQDAQLAEAPAGGSGLSALRDSIRAHDLPAVIVQYQELVRELTRLGQPDDAQRVREIIVQLQRFAALDPKR